MKRCPRCKKEQSLKDCFYTTAKGVYSWCKECCSELGKQRYQRRREIELAKANEWWKNAPLDQVNARRRRWYVSSPGEQQKHRKNVREWEKKNPEKRQVNARRSGTTRRARKLLAFVEVVDPQVVFERYEGVCGICNTPVDPDRYDVDHVIPLARGGKHSYANCQLAHPYCNKVKGVSLRRVEDSAEKGDLIHA